ncbi:MAG: undecaprenyl-phosphate glucose phosphotransferase [Odoribacter sp.]|nr:undecaprenyl-phosphate glucose phosphotransferase [Odoribacter sp.]
MKQALQNTFVANLAIILGDFILLNVVFAILFNLYPEILNYRTGESFNKDEYFLLVNLFYLPCVILWPPILVDRFSKLENMMKRTVYMVLLHAMCFVLYIFAIHSNLMFPYTIGQTLRISLPWPNIIRILGVYISWWGCLFLWRFCVRLLIRRIRASRFYKRRLVVFVGTHKGALELWKQLQDVGIGYRTLGYFADTVDERWQMNILSGGKKLPPATYLGKVEELKSWLENNQVQELYCCLQTSDTERIDEIYTLCEKLCIRFYAVPDVKSMYLYNMRYAMMGKVMIMQERKEPLLQQGNRIVKRTFDLIVSGLFLVTLFPWIYLFVAIVTKVTSPGPVFFKQERSGLNGKVFTMYKFRSMHVNKDADRIQATENDPRKTKFGNFLRKSSIDELPQFINVFKGDMSVVGPRPHMLLHTEMYSELIKQYMVRHLAKPGVTGWAQVTGYRGETKELEQMEGRVRRDIYYIEHWSLWLDIRIMFMTVYNAIAGDKNAY